MSAGFASGFRAVLAGLWMYVGLGVLGLCLCGLGFRGLPKGTLGCGWRGPGANPQAAVPPGGFGQLRLEGFRDYSREPGSLFFCHKNEVEIS